MEWLKLLLFQVQMILITCPKVGILGYSNKTKHTKCFKTVQYYRSNSMVTGNSKLYLTYQNDYFKNTTFHLDCNGTGLIQIDRVYLMLPTTEEGYCLEAAETDKKCPSSSPCECCRIPKKTCHYEVTNKYASCYGRETCDLDIMSEFLEDCPGRKYDCANQKCHSRWAEVIYSCYPITDATSKTTPKPKPPVLSAGE